MNTPDNTFSKPALIALAIFSVFCVLLGLVFGMDPVKLITYFSPAYFIIFGIVYAFRATFPPDENNTKD